MDLERLLKFYRAAYDVTYQDIADVIGIREQTLIKVRKGQRELTVREFVLLWDMLRAMDPTITFEDMLEALPMVNRKGTWAEHVTTTRKTTPLVKATYHRDGKVFVRK